MVRPPWFTAAPLTTPRIRSPSRSASSQRRSTTATAPSPGTKPSAVLSKARLRWRGESAIMSPIDRKYSGLMPACTAPMTAVSMSPERRCWSAECRATSDDEQSVLTTVLGPRQSIRYESRLAIIASRPRPRPSGTPWRTRSSW
ncbi:hypothetical protein BG846_03693 [Streptomyces fradiae ATCC 10745 = DSM 40063]|uniref:Uncharacterized protein n=1 Tax=Streptomyces fradiae ATCC 10745 = DSM 40063 TaxID=1319510 RepID=A0A1Y2NUG4_STRFR|nr:hypothetical protein BG846_03693 [Streptomyces fradiae ATCC 10745 = DSM 40063]